MLRRSLPVLKGCCSSVLLVLSCLTLLQQCPSIALRVGAASPPVSPPATDGFLTVFPPDGTEPTRVPIPNRTLGELITTTELMASWQASHPNHAKAMVRLVEVEDERGLQPHRSCTRTAGALVLSSQV